MESEINTGMTGMSEQHENTQQLILNNIIEMRGELSTVIQTQKSAEKHGDRIKSLEDTRMWVYGAIATISGVAGAVYLLITDKIENIKGIIAHLDKGP